MYCAVRRRDGGGLCALMWVNQNLDRYGRQGVSTRDVRGRDEEELTHSEFRISGNQLLFHPQVKVQLNVGNLREQNFVRAPPTTREVMVILLWPTGKTSPPSISPRPPAAHLCGRVCV